MLDTGGWKDLKNVRLSGVMGMATNVDDDEQIKREFCSLNTFFKEIKQNYFSDSEYFKEISMGMSHDYPLAVGSRKYTSQGRKQNLWRTKLLKLLFI